MNTRQPPFDTHMAMDSRPASRLGEKFASVRSISLRLAAPLSDEDCCAQSMPEASPVKWHLAHTTWFFETFVLEMHEKNFRPFHPAFRVLFNSYYNGVGDKHPRPRRGMLTRPPLSLVRAYREDVDARMAGAIARYGHLQSFRDIAVLGVNHEQQHQELMLTDLKHLLSQNPLWPAYRELPPSPVRNANPIQWIGFSGGIVETGARPPPGAADETGDAFCFDNELPRHKQYLSSYEMASRLVTNAEYLRFIEAGGYGEARHWLSDGWDWVRANGIGNPIYWVFENDSWCEFTLHGLRQLNPDSPVAHISYFEADAYARYAGARLPTEGEWEHASEACETTGNFLDGECPHPHPAQGEGLQQMFGDLWEWTSSSYAPYPGYLTPDGAIGEYNGKFMVNQYVLRGGSCATPRDHIRSSYRNFFPTSTRWQFTGIRLARDA